jgi:hypothetical protein
VSQASRSIASARAYIASAPLESAFFVSRSPMAIAVSEVGAVFINAP